MNCKNHKIRTKKGIKYGYCTLLKKEVPLFGCKCNSIAYPEIKKIKTSSSMKKRSYKLAKAEKNRFSIIYQDLDHCAVCGKLATDKHEVFNGAYRQASIKYGCVMPLCREHHEKMHSDREFALIYKVMFEEKFIELHGYDEFMRVFKKDYR